MAKPKKNVTKAKKTRSKKSEKNDSTPSSVQNTREGSEKVTGNPESTPASKATASNGKSHQAEPVPATAPGEEITQAQYRGIEEHDQELPLEYNDTKVVVLVRDPEWIFTYWELSDDTRRQYGIERGQPRRPLVLRLHTLESKEDVPSEDVVVNDYTSSWYLRVPGGSASRFQVELGTRDEQGEFLRIAESNIVELPHMGLSEEADVDFAEIDDEIYDQILHLSGGVHISEHLGSDEFLRSMQERIYDSLFGAPFASAGLMGSQAVSSFGLPTSGMFSGEFSSGGLSSSSLPQLRMPSAGGDSVQHARSVPDEFWLEVGVDVIVYGATEPNAKVKFMGEDIDLNSDGTFRFRMVFPDDTIEFPIEATSADGKHTRKVKPVVTRKTEGDPRKPS